MSDSGPSANAGIPTGTGSGTNVVYKVSFQTTNTTNSIGGIVVDFCSNSPIIGDSCTAPTGMNGNSTSLSVNNQTGLGTGTYSVYTTTPTNNRIILSRGTAANMTSSGSFELGNGTSNGITNPSTTGTFYARVYTYATAATAQSHNSNSPTNYLDYGGIALSTASVITNTARVQENIIFCVLGGEAPTANCTPAGGSTAPALSIGHTGSGTAKYIDSTAVDTADAFMQVSTNAGFGAVVHMRTSTTDGGLISGPNSIPPASSGSNTPAAITAGSAAFGVLVFPGTGTFGALTPAANYYDVAHDTGGEGYYYGMDSTTSGNNVTTTFGDQIATTSNTVASNMTSRLTFAATASNITPAGLYSANLSLIATGTF